MVFKIANNFLFSVSSNVGITSFSRKQLSKLSLPLVLNMQTHFVCSQRSFKTEMYLCEMTHTDCSACLREKASCDIMFFFFINSFVALQSSMKYKVGEPEYLLKNILK